MGSLQLLIFLALANGSIAMTVTQSRIFRPLRRMLAHHLDSSWLYELFSCPYCFSHWLAFAAVAIWRVRLTNCEFAPADYVVSAFVLTTLSATMAGILRRIYEPGGDDE